MAAMDKGEISEFLGLESETAKRIVELENDEPQPGVSPRKSKWRSQREHRLADAQE
jgi:hypothetical protein